jgi:hypothetical protein
VKRLIAVVVVGLGWNVNAMAANATVSLSENSALLKYSLVVGGQSFGRSEAGVGVVFNSDDGYVVEGDFHVVDEAAARLPGLKIGLGAKAYGAVKDKHELAAIGLGGLVRYSIPGAVRLFIGADGYYSPAIVAFGDSKRFWEWSGLVGYEVLPQANVFLEYREFKSVDDTSGGVVSIDAGPRLGVAINF